MDAKPDPGAKFVPGKTETYTARDDPKLIYGAAVHAYHSAQYTASLAGCNRILARWPDDPEALILRSLCRARLGDWPAADADYAHARRVAPTDPETIYTEACLLALRGDAPGALAALAALLQTSTFPPARAATDSDFTSLQADPSFRALVGLPPR